MVAEQRIIQIAETFLNAKLILKKQDILRKKYPYNCFAMTMYQLLLMALVSLPFCVLENWGLKK